MVFKINSNQVKVPSKLDYQLSDIDLSTERSASGIMYRDRIGTKVKLNLEWPAMKTNDLNKLLNAIKNEFFTVTYFDPFANKEITKTFYAGDRNAPMYSNHLNLWSGFKVNFIEK